MPPKKFRFAHLAPLPQPSHSTKSHDFTALRVPGSDPDFGHAPEDGCRAHEARYSDWLGHPSPNKPKP